MNKLNMQILLDINDFLAKIRKEPLTKIEAEHFLETRLVTSFNQKNITETNEVYPKFGLFPHQKTVINAIDFHGNNVHTLVQMPTGSGKTRTGIHIIKKFIEHESNKSTYNFRTKIIWAVNSRILVNQAKSEFDKGWRHIGSDIVNSVVIRTENDKSIIRDNNDKNQIIFLTIQQLIEYKNNDIDFYRVLLDGTKLFIFDEAHSSGATSYMSALRSIESEQPNITVIGLTATPDRPASADNINTHNFINFYRKIVRITLEDNSKNVIEYLQSNSFLAKIRINTIVVENDNKVGEILKELERLCRGIEIRKRTIIFTERIENSKLLTVLINYIYGNDISAKFISESTKDEERDAIISWFKDDNESCKVLVNTRLLTEGFDAPKTDSIIYCKNFNDSYIELSQIFGRCMRGEKAGGNKDSTLVFIQTRDLINQPPSPSELYMKWYDTWDNIR